MFRMVFNSSNFLDSRGKGKWVADASHTSVACHDFEEKFVREHVSVSCWDSVSQKSTFKPFLKATWKATSYKMCSGTSQRLELKHQFYTLHLRFCLSSGMIAKGATQTAGTKNCFTGSACDIGGHREAEPREETSTQIHLFIANVANGANGSKYLFKQEGLRRPQ